MPQEFNAYQPPHPNRGAKIVLASIATLLGIVVLIFLGFFVYYTWQFKYGDPEQVEKLARQIQSDKFTLVDSNQKAKTETEKPVAKYIRPHNPTMGNLQAPVTIVAFIDFECPYCQAAHPVFKQVQQTYGTAVKFVFKHMPLTSIHPRAASAALAAQCAHEQGKFWQYHDILFTKKQLDDESLVSAAETVGLNMESFASCYDTQRYSQDVQADLIDGVDLGVRGTPTYFVNQHIVEGVLDLSQWNEIIVEQLKP